MRLLYSHTLHGAQDMKLAEYITYDGLGIAELIRNRESSREEALKCAMDAAELLNPEINAIIELFPEPLAASDDAGAPFHGVPFLIKDLALHAEGVLNEMGSRLAQGIRAQHDTDLMKRFRQVGLLMRITWRQPSSPVTGRASRSRRKPCSGHRQPRTRCAGASADSSRSTMSCSPLPWRNRRCRWALSMPMIPAWMQGLGRCVRLNSARSRRCSTPPANRQSRCRYTAAPPTCRWAYNSPAATAPNTPCCNSPANLNRPRPGR